MNRTCNQTKEYNLFKGLEGNRNINYNHVKKIKDSIINNGNISAITCISDKDGKYIIVDGQHRYMACRELDIPIIFDVWDNINTNSMISLNKDQCNWKLIDYLNYGCSSGIEDYVVLKEYSTKNKIALSSLIIILGNCNDVKYSFKNMVWKISDKETADKMLSYLDDFHKKFGIEHRLHVKFIQGFKTVIKTGLYDHERMLHQLTKCHSFMLKQPNVSSYISNIEKIYNYRVVSDKKVSFSKGK